MKTAKDLFLIVASIGIAVAAGMLIYWGLLDDDDPTIVLSYEAIGQSSPGGWQTMRIKGIELRKGACFVDHVTRNYIDSKGALHVANTVFGSAAWNLPAGGYDVTFRFKVTEDTALGVGRMLVIVFYRCNPLKLIPVSMPQATFEVVKP